MITAFLSDMWTVGLKIPPGLQDRTGHAWRRWVMSDRREGMRQDALAQREADQLDVGADAEFVFDERVEIGDSLGTEVQCAGDLVSSSFGQQHLQDLEL